MVRVVVGVEVQPSIADERQGIRYFQSDARGLAVEAERLDSAVDRYDDVESEHLSFVTAPMDRVEVLNPAKDV